MPHEQPDASQPQTGGLSALLETLTPRERDILARRQRGDTYKAIAADLGISINTVSAHAKSILRKSLAGSTLEALHHRSQV